MTRAQAFVDELAALSFENVFNPYADCCPEHDRPDAPAIRRRNLVRVLEAAQALGTDTIWFGRDPLRPCSGTPSLSIPMNQSNQ